MANEAREFTLAAAQSRALDSVGWAQFHFGAAFTSRQTPRRVVLSLCALRWSDALAHPRDKFRPPQHAGQERRGKQRKRMLNNSTDRPPLSARFLSGSGFDSRRLHYKTRPRTPPCDSGGVRVALSHCDCAGCRRCKRCHRAWGVR